MSNYVYIIFTLKKTLTSWIYETEVIKLSIYLCLLDGDE